MELTNPVAGHAELLCLKCRGSGHVVRDCLSTEWLHEYDWDFSERRRSFAFDAPTTALNELCPRCISLEVLSTLNKHPPWCDQNELEKAFEALDEPIKYLGKTGTVIYTSNCQLCLCLFSLTPSPSSNDQDIYIFPDWTLCRVAGEKGTPAKAKDKKRYATCLAVVLRPSVMNLSIPIRGHRGDALCLVQSGIEDGRGLGARALAMAGFDVDIAKQWLNSCITLHGNVCGSTHTDELKNIRLLDIVSMRVVEYPGPSCVYVALSYVWGADKQSDYRLDDRVSQLPASLHDAILVTKALGKRYIWIDSICITQSDEVDKGEQINRMWSIYRGAYLTILLLSTDRASAGLSQFGRRAPYPQMKCCIDGKLLVGLGLTLSQQIWRCPWGKRAWTLQEALLSPRCLYISDQQLYFECSAMQCCESLDTSTSPGHNLKVNDAPCPEEFPTWVMDQIGPGCLRTLLDSRLTRMDTWGACVILYCFRTMSHVRDGERAFVGILQRLQEMYQEGFYYGLPHEDFDWALLWWSRWPAKRREGLPSWSFVGWEGGVSPTEPSDISKPRRFPVHLHIYKAMNGSLSSIFHSSNFSCQDTSTIAFVILHDAIAKAAQEAPVEDPFATMQGTTVTESNRLLYVDAVTMDFEPNFAQNHASARISGAFVLFIYSISNTRCIFLVSATDNIITSPPSTNKKCFVLLARDFAQGHVVHHLMLIEWLPLNQIAQRIAVLQLWVPLDKLHVLAELGVSRRRFILG